MNQQVFFTASAPLTGKHVNISPKGLPSSTFSIFDPNHAAYVDATGSGSETISHVYENGRVTIMFCSFARSPRIMRFFCMGKVIEWGSPKFEPLLQKMAKKRIEGARAVILLDVFKVNLFCVAEVYLPMILGTNILWIWCPLPHRSPQVREYRFSKRGEARARRQRYDGSLGKSQDRDEFAIGISSAE